MTTGARTVPAGELELEAPVVGVVTADDRAQQRQVGAESLRLAAGEAGELGAGDPTRKAEEVLDSRRVRGLAARDVALASPGSAEQTIG